MSVLRWIRRWIGRNGSRGVGLIAFAAASSVSPRPRDEDLSFLTDEKRYVRRSGWYRVQRRELTAHLPSHLPKTGGCQ